MNKKIALLSLLLSVMNLFAQTIEIPGWVDLEIQKAYDRFLVWKGNDDVLLFPMQTDVHSGGRDTYRHVAYVNHAAKTFSFDFIADLGDIGLDTEETREPEKARAFLKRHMDIHRQYPGVSFVLIGNHDANRIAGDGRFKDRELAEYFTIPAMEKAQGRLVLAENPSYGFIDVPERKTRVFFMNTSDQDDKAYYTMSINQLQFLADHLLAPEDGWSAIILTHFCVRPMGHWVEYQDYLAHGTVFLQIIHDCNARARGEGDTVRWDFSQGHPCHVVANLCGDSHFDATEVYDGVFYAISQGYGGVGNSSMPKEASKTSFDPNGQMLVDIAAYKPATHELKLFRMGAGGAEKDRSFQW